MTAYPDFVSVDLPAAAGGAGGPIAYEVSGRPSWLALSSDLVLSGQPVSPGTFDLVYTATSGGHTVSRSFTLTVAEMPDPPEGEGYTDCVPTTTPLHFGDYRVAMCYETPDGLVGDGRGGVYASGGSGLLWFFSRDNAEVLIKVLDGCAINDHYWVFAAPATDLAFNLHVSDSQGRTWTHRNRQGMTAVNRSDTSAFSCN